MDLFTHMMVSYLLGQGCGLAFGGVTEPQLLFAVIAGIFPDFDILTFPGWRWLPRLRHHGLTHTLLFPVMNALVLSFIVYTVWGLDPLQFIPLGLLTGVFHVVSDLITNFPVPLLAPVSWRGYSFAIDAAVNPYTLLPSLALIAVFWNLRASEFDYGQFRLMLLGVALALLAHFLVKLSLKLALRRRFRGEAWRVDAHPTFRYLTWYLMLMRKMDGAVVTEYQKLRFGREGRETRFYEVSLPAGVWSAGRGAMGENKIRAGGPEENAVAGGAGAPLVDGRDRAIALSFSRVMGRADVLGRNEDAAAVVSDRPEGGWEVFWFRWWSAYAPPVRGLLVTVLPDGSCEVESAVREVDV
ncbi:MAG: metal-dependent hydrolase [Thermoplasmatota archaeon]